MADQLEDQPAVTPEAVRTAVVWRCAFCPIEGTTWWMPEAFSALAVHVARYHPLGLTSVGSVAPTHPVCDSTQRHPGGVPPVTG